MILLSFAMGFQVTQTGLKLILAEDDSEFPSLQPLSARVRSSYHCTCLQDKLPYKFFLPCISTCWDSRPVAQCLVKQKLTKYNRGKDVQVVTRPKTHEATDLNRFREERGAVACETAQWGNTIAAMSITRV